MSYKIVNIIIDNGVIHSEHVGKTKRQRDFVVAKTVLEVFRVMGWKFTKVYLEHGNQENGYGFAFIKV